MNDAERAYENWQRLSAETADAYRQRRGDPLIEDRQQQEEQPPKPHKLDTMPIDWHAEIADAIAAERQRSFDILAGVIAEMQTQGADDLERATRSLTAELADLKATLAELRLTMASAKSVPLDLPSPLRARVN